MPHVPLPTGIEMHLKEAGFSVTEMLVLKKLVEGETFTIRELAAKTGKSTGILDQAMKKLLSKNIARREAVNGQPRYSIRSLDAIIRWGEEDMKHRHAALERKHENFESFIASLKVDKLRPDMEYFQGLQGIEQAYMKLLESGEELLTLTPVLTTAEDDPLRVFRVEYFRKRQYRKIFQRVLAPDTPLSRRFQSRDAFEYRRTLLLPEQEHHISFEKTIVDGTIACINFTDQTACFLRFPELAKAERAAFESLWNRRLEEERQSVSAPQHAPHVPVKTRMFSRVREFILSKHSIAAFAAFAILSAALTFGLYRNVQAMNLQRVRERALSIASTGALQFDARDIEAVRTPADISKPQYAKLVATLNMIRRQNPGVQYAYIFRKTDDPDALAFVADADSLHPYEKKDLNSDGKIDASDQLNTPGELYDISRFPYYRFAYEKPIADPAPTTDQWGTFIAAAAPIKDESGQVVGVFGIDVHASDINSLTAQAFSPLFVFVGLFLLFFVVRFGAVNKPLLKEIIRAVNIKRVLFGSLIALIIFIYIFYALYCYTLNIIIQETGQRLMSIAATAASQFDPKDLDQLHFARDMKTEAYQRVFRKLNEIRNNNPEITWAYIMRPTKQPHLFEFIADADANYNLPHLISDLDYRKKGSATPADINVWPGFQYDSGNDELLNKALVKPFFDQPLYDQWGFLVTGAAPIVRAGQSIALVGFDIDMGYLYKRAFYKIMDF